jgi:hypothetical protein
MPLSMQVPSMRTPSGDLLPEKVSEFLGIPKVKLVEAIVKKNCAEVDSSIRENIIQSNYERLEHLVALLQIMLNSDENHAQKWLFSSKPGLLPDQPEKEVVPASLIKKGEIELVISFVEKRIFNK